VLAVFFLTRKPKPEPENVTPESGRVNAGEQDEGVMVICVNPATEAIVQTEPAIVIWVPLIQFALK
jgi:hypothetical protein